MLGVPGRASAAEMGGSEGKVFLRVLMECAGHRDTGAGLWLVVRTAVLAQMGQINGCPA